MLTSSTTFNRIGISSSISTAKMLLAIMLISAGCQNGENFSNVKPDNGSRSDFNQSQLAINPAAPEFESADNHAESDGESPTKFSQTTVEIQLERKVTRAEFLEICTLANLETLILDGGGIGPQDIKQLLDLKKLEHIRIRNCPIDDEGVNVIASLRNLRIVNFPQAKFSDEGLKLLAKLPRLQLLRFSSPRVTDAGMVPLKESPTLTALHLIRVPITNRCIKDLGAIQSLESLYLDGSKIDDQGYRQLFKLRPNIHLHVDQVHLDYDPNRHRH